MQGPITILTSAWNHYVHHFKLLTSIYFIPWLFSVVLTFPFFLNSESVTANIFITLFTLVSLVLNILVGIALLRAISAPNETTTISAYSFAKGYFWPFSWVVFLVTAIEFLGFVLFIIPGIIVMVWYTFVIYTFIFEGKRGMDALKASREYVRGNWYAVFGRIIFIIILVILFVGIFVGISLFIPGGEVVQKVFVQISSLVISPVALVYIYIMYTDIKSISLGITLNETQSHENVQIENAVSEVQTNPESS